MKILLLSPPFVKEYMRNARCDFVSLSATQWFPLWLGYCGCYLEKSNRSVKIIDAPAYGLSHNQTESIIEEYKPDAILVYSGNKSEDNDIVFAERIYNKLQVPVIFAGPFFSINPKRTLAKSNVLKYGIYGEFEKPFSEFIESGEPATIKNFVWKDESGEIIINEQRPYLDSKTLDEFPFVSDFFYRNLDYKYYRTPSEPHPFTDIMSGRGCVWGQCSYCLWVHCFIKGKTYNTRSIENVIEEFNFVEKKIGSIKSIMIQDDTFTADRAFSFSEKKIKSGNKLKWSCYSRPNLDYETLKIMKRAGCLNVHTGFESGNKQILKKIKKGVTKEQMYKFAESARKAGLRIHADFAIGFPGETEETVKETIKFALEIKPYTAQFQVMIPFPGTPFYNELESAGYLKNGLPDYPDLSSESIECQSKKAYRSFYFSFHFFKNVIAHPFDLLFGRLKTYIRAVPSVFWKKMEIR